MDVINVKGEVAYAGEKLGFVLSGNYFQYTPLHELKAWHKPNYEIKLSADYKIQNKIIVKADLLAYGTAYAKLIDVKGIAVAEKINGYVDGNLSIDYRYTKKLSVFVEFNNIASAKYNKWYNYPTRRFSLLAGVTYSFL
jgi:outer membrane receptor protein involved in Fe transport